MAFSLTSPKFQDHAEIPFEHTREGGDVPPPLAWRDVPAGTKSFALVCEDPDAPDPAHPQRTFVHWVLYNLPATASSLPEDVHAARGLPEGAQVGKNDWKETGYGGPAPPIGRHRYFFRLFALDTVLSDARALTRAELERRMQGHVLGTAEFVGTYEAKKKNQRLAS